MSNEPDARTVIPGRMVTYHQMGDESRSMNRPSVPKDIFAKMIKFYPPVQGFFASRGPHERDDTSLSVGTIIGPVPEFPEIARVFIRPSPGAKQAFPGLAGSLAAAKELVARLQAAIYDIEVSSEVTQRRPRHPEE